MLTLYSTAACHLCEQAYAQLEQLSIQDSVQVIDIAFDDVLFSRYGVTIPVLAWHAVNMIESQNDVTHIESELFWPFNLEELQAWLEDNGINYHS